MSGQPAEQSEGFTSTDSRLDAILDQLNALGSSTPEQQKAAPTLRSVPDLPVPVIAEPSTEDSQGTTPGAPETALPPDVPMPPAPLAAVPNPAPAVAPPPLPVPQAPALPEIEPIAEPTNFTFGQPDEPTLQPQASGVAPEPATLAQPDIFDLAPVDDEPVESIEPMPVVVEYHAEGTEVAEVAEITAAPQLADASDSERLVFELDGLLEEEPVSTHEAPHIAETSPDAAMLETVPTTPPPVPPSGDTGWVSHHDETNEDTDAEALGSEPTVAAIEAPNVDTDRDDVVTGPASFESPEWGEVVENDDVVEDVPFSAFNPHASSDKGSPGYTTDEELPIPDFTGVWDDAGVPDVWDAENSSLSAVPDPVEIPGSGSGISVGRNELDSLRPVEEEKAAREPAQNLGRKMQLFAVILFGLIALAVVLLNDPAAVDELRTIYDGFFG